VPVPSLDEGEGEANALCCHSVVEMKLLHLLTAEASI